MKWEVIGSGSLRDTGPNSHSAKFCRISEMPKVTRMVLSGSRPISGRKVTTCNAAPRMATISVATMSASQKFPGRRHHHHAEIGAEHEQFAVREIHHVHDAEDQRQAGGDQRQDQAGDDAVDGLDQQQVEREVLEELDHRVHRYTPRYCLMTGSSTLRSEAAQ